MEIKITLKSVLSEKGNKIYRENFDIDILKLKNKISTYEKLLENNHDANQVITNEYSEVYSKINEYTYAQIESEFPLDIVGVNNKLVGFIFTGSEGVTILVKDGYEDYTPLKYEENILNVL